MAMSADEGKVEAQQEKPILSPNMVISRLGRYVP
jgi:hypothetical protein